MNASKRLLSEAEVAQLRIKYEELKVLFRAFDSAHDKYSEGLKEEDLTANDLYYDNVLGEYTAHMTDVRSFLSSKEFIATPLGKLPPAPEPDTFTGNPEMYPLWKASFNTLVGKHSISSDKKMFYLRKYT